MAAAAQGADQRAADELSDTAERARIRSDFATAARALTRSAELCPEDDEMARRLLAAAIDAFTAGSPGQAATLCQRARARAADERLRGDIDIWNARAYTWLGDPREAHDLLVAGANLRKDEDPGQAASMLAEAIPPAVMDARVPLALAEAREAERLVELADTADKSGVVRCLRWALIVNGYIGEAQVLEASGHRDPAGTPTSELLPLCYEAEFLLFSERFETARHLLRFVIEASRTGGAPAALSYALAARSEASWWIGRWGPGLADATEAISWAEELGQPAANAFSLLCLGRLEASLGNTRQCERVLDRARRVLEAVSIPSLQVYVGAISGFAALASQQPDVAAAKLSRSFAITETHGLGIPNAVPFAADLVEAMVHARLPGHEPVLRWLEVSSDRSGCAWPAGALARCLGLLASSQAEADDLFEKSETAFSGAQMPFELARTQLCRGEILRRYRHATDARGYLRKAMATFTELGAKPWARRAAAELASAGDTAPEPARRPVIDGLTPQELQIARVVAAGKNNIETAAALYVSRKTVEAHLTRIYRKLGVRTRTDLARELTASGALDT